MAFTLVLNSANVTGSNNSQFTYKFMTGNFIAKDMEMCVSSASIPYSWFNVTSYYNNTKLTINFPTGATSVALNIVLPAGYYAISDINSFIQNQCILNGLYLINSSGQNVFFFQMVTDVNYYAIQTIYFTVPTSATYVGLGYTLPPILSTGFNQYTTTAGLPTTSTQIPQMILNSSSPTVMMGYAQGTYPASSVSSSTVSILGTLTPNGSTVNSLIARVNCLRNTIVMPSDILDAFPINASFGGAITYTPSFERWIAISDGAYSNMTLTLCDQNYNTVYSNDPNVIITLMIRKKL